MAMRGVKFNPNPQTKEANVSPSCCCPIYLYGLQIYHSVIALRAHATCFAVAHKASLAKQSASQSQD